MYLKSIITNTFYQPYSGKKKSSISKKKILFHQALWFFFFSQIQKIKRVSRRIKVQFKKVCCIYLSYSCYKNDVYLKVNYNRFTVILLQKHTQKKKKIKHLSLLPTKKKFLFHPIRWICSSLFSGKSEMYLKSIITDTLFSFTQKKKNQASRRKDFCPVAPKIPFHLKLCDVVLLECYYLPFGYRGIWPSNRSHGKRTGRK